MTRARVGLLFAVFVLLGCAHHRPANSEPAAATPQPDTAYTGAPPVYPRALPVSLPPSAPPPAATAPAPVSVSATPPAETPVPPAPPIASTADTTSTASASAPEISASTNSAPDSSTAPAPSSETNSDMARADMIPPTPSVATVPPTAMDEEEANKQVVVLVTSLGRIVIELDDVSAPRTCGNFRKLVSSGFYDHTTFHRVIPNFMIQGGDPNSKSDDRATYGQGDPGYTLAAEIKLKHTAGAVAMARLPDSVNPQRESNGSQFFICVTTCPSLDSQYTVFGHVIAGMDTAIKIADQPRDAKDDPVDRIEMQVTLESKRQALQDAP